MKGIFIKITSFIILLMVVFISSCTVKKDDDNYDIKKHSFDTTYECIDRKCSLCNEVIKATIEHKFNKDGFCECSAYCGINDVESSNGIIYEYDRENKTYIVADCFECTDKNIILRSKINNCDVVEIKENAFRLSYYVDSITIPTSIKKIDIDAFPNKSKVKQIIYEGTHAQLDELILNNEEFYVDKTFGSDTGTFIPIKLNYFFITYVNSNGSILDKVEVKKGQIINLPNYGDDCKFYLEKEEIKFGFTFSYDNDITIVCKEYVEELVTYTFNDYTRVSPSNWNELTYQDNNDTQILKYIQSPFFEFNYKYDINGEIIPGDFVVEYSAATKLEDVSAEYAGEEAGWGIPEGATSRAYKITLRQDLKWDDGTAIYAKDFVYSMKEQLNPDFQNYRADSFYDGDIIIHNAEKYIKQGQTQTVSARKSYTEWEVAKADENIYFSLGSEGGVGAFVAENYGSYLKQGATPAWVVSALGCEATEAEILSLEGKSFIEISADETLSAIWAKVIGWWQPNPNEELDFFSYDYTFPKTDFSSVGIFVGDTPYELVVVLDKALHLLKENGELAYTAVYKFSSLPLVKEDKYEYNKVAPVTGSTLWTSTYNSSVNTTASWGPYRLTSFQTGKQYILERNPNWFGYNDPEYAGQYQTDKIVVDTIQYWSDALLKFLKGEIDGIGIDVTIADDYKGSDRAYFTSSDFVGSLHLQSDYDQLKAREENGINKSILAYKDFRQALSLSIDRDEFTKKTTTSSKAGFGLFNTMHYYDVANGKLYRNEDVAKEVLCDIYGIDVSKYASLDEAYDAITGYNLTLARQLLEKAYAEALAAGDIKATDIVRITMGSGAINEVVSKQFNFIQASWLELVKGTSLEGRLEFDEIQDFGDTWATDFRVGKYDVCMGGWTGAAWDPGYFLLAYLGDGYRYATAWDPDVVELEFTMPGALENGEDVTDTMSLMDWYDCLNSNPGCKYAWGFGDLEESKRLLLIAALEKEILNVYYTVPLYNEFSASLISYKIEFASYEYNTFINYNDVRFITYNYTDQAWEEYVANNGGELDYK